MSLKGSLIFPLSVASPQEAGERREVKRKMGRVSKKLIDQLSELTREEQLQVLHFIEFLKYHRERVEDAALAEYIKSGLEDEFLTVKEAIRYLKELEDVGD